MQVQQAGARHRLQAGLHRRQVLGQGLARASNPVKALGGGRLRQRLQLTAAAAGLQMENAQRGCGCSRFSGQIGL